MKTVNLEFGIPIGNITSTAFSAYNSGGTIVVILGGTPVPLTTLNYNNGFTFTTGGSTITVPTAGTYWLNYSIRTTTSLLMTASMLRNGTTLPRMTSNPGLAGNNYTGSGMITLTAGDTLALQLSGIASTVVLGSGAGATVNILRIA